SYHQVTPLQAIAVWLEPDWSLVPQTDLYPTGNVALENQRSISEMDQSKIDATWVVLRRLTTYPKQHGAGALVESTVPDCSADGRLFPGDVITAIDGHPVGDTADVRRILHVAKEGGPDDRGHGDDRPAWQRGPDRWDPRQGGRCRACGSEHLPGPGRRHGRAGRRGYAGNAGDLGRDLRRRPASAPPWRNDDVK